MLKTNIVLVIALSTTSLVIAIGLLVHVCPGTMIYDEIMNQCVLGSTGWKITGYFLPLESDYVNDSSLSVYVKSKDDDPTDYVENNTKYYLKKFSYQFITEVNTQGSGKTRDNKFLQTWVDDYFYPNQTKTRFYHFESCPRTSSGICLPVVSSSFDTPLVMVAVTKGTTDLSSGVIEQGMIFHIPNIAKPWNSKTFWAVDVGEWHDKHVDVYTGYGLKASEEAKRITKLPPDESGTVLIIGFKPINETR